jgi:dTDP-glucose 4,6-dehydratase
MVVVVGPKYQQSAYFMSKHMLLPGGCGFIASHLVEHVLANTDWTITVLDALTYAGDPSRLYEAGKFDRGRIRIFWTDLNSPIMETLARRIGEVDFIVNLASNSHIDHSIADPVPFVKNNVNIALHMLDYARKLPGLKAFIQFSTDEIYGSVEAGQQLSEWSPINPSNPYSASKAAQVDLAIAFRRTYGLPIVIVEVMNNFGERQDREKFIPKCVRSISAGEEITLHGTPDNIGSRYYLHARNTSDAILFLLQRTPSRYPKTDLPDRYNIVGDRRVDNLQMARRISSILGCSLRYRFDHSPRSRPGHDLHYGLDGSKLAALGWCPPVDFEISLERTVKWMIKNPCW